MHWFGLAEAPSGSAPQRAARSWGRPSRCVRCSSAWQRSTAPNDTQWQRIRSDPSCCGAPGAGAAHAYLQAVREPSRAQWGYGSAKPAAAIRSESCNAHARMSARRCEAQTARNRRCGHESAKHAWNVQMAGLLYLVVIVNAADAAVLQLLRLHRTEIQQRKNPWRPSMVSSAQYAYLLVECTAAKMTAVCAASPKGHVAPKGTARQNTAARRARAALRRHTAQCTSDTERVE